MISYESAIEAVKKEFRGIKVKTERVGIIESLNRILAEDIYADVPQPPFTNSAMDGYAIKFKKGVSGWKLAGEISAGRFRNYNLNDSLAVSIMTGSKMPDNADSVIPIENVMVEKKIIRLKEGFTFKKGSNVRTIGEDVQKNIRVIEKNQVIRSTNIQLLASCGKKYVRVFRKPVIAILASGNELIDIGKKPFNDKIRSSNYYSLLVSAAESGFEPFGFGIVNDSKKHLKQTIKKALNSNIDIFITSGGVSEGKYDFLPEIYKELGVTLKFHKVNIKPGKPILFGVYSLRNKKILIFGLPGNPVSCFINYILFIKNIFMELYTRDSGNKVKAELKLSIAKKDNKTHFLRGVLIEREGINYVIPERNQSSANALGLSKANVLIKFPGEINKCKKGSLVSCIKI